MDIESKIAMIDNSSSVNETILVQGLSSLEYYYEEKIKDTPIQVLKDINFKLKRQEVCCVLSEKTYEIKLLLDIVSGTRPYQGGQCVINNQDIREKNQTIIDDVFYLASTRMLYENMTVLEYLTLLTSNKSERHTLLQLENLDFICELGLGYISLTYIIYLTPAEKTLVLLLAALYSKSNIIIMNLPRIKYNNKEIVVFERIVREIKKANASLVLGTNDYTLVNQVGDQILFLNDGKVNHFCSKKSFVSYDKLEYLIIFKDKPKIDISKILVNIKVKQIHNKLYIYEPIVLHKIIDILEEYDLKIIKISKNRPNVSNALHSILKGEDYV